MRLDPDKDELDDIIKLKSLITGDKLTDQPVKKKFELNHNIFQSDNNN